MSKICSGLAIALICLITPLHAAENLRKKVAVAYPADLNSAKTNVYKEVISGIQAVIPDVSVIAINNAQTDLQPQLETLRPDQVIALTKPLAAALQASGFRDKMLCGAYYSPPGSCPGVSLALNGAKMIQFLRAALPQTKQIFFIYESSLAGVDLPASGESVFEQIRVKNVPAKDTLEAIYLAGNIIEHEAQPVRDIVVIPPNLPEDIIFKIIAAAWEKKITLVSTNYAHLDFGVLMTFAPDFNEMGRQLGRLSLEGHAAWQASSSLKAALNNFVAKHLNVELPDSGKIHFYQRIK